MPAKELYANRFSVHVSETIAGTRAFAEVPTYAAAFSKEAFIIHRLEYAFTDASLDALVANDDMLMAGLCTSNKVYGLNPVDSFPEPGVLDVVKITGNLRGAAANLFLNQIPIVKDFTNLPGGGFIVPSRPLFVAVQGGGLVAAVTVDVRGWFTRVELKDAEFLELLDAYRLVV